MIATETLASCCHCLGVLCYVELASNDYHALNICTVKDSRSRSWRHGYRCYKRRMIEEEWETHIDSPSISLELRSV